MPLVMQHVEGLPQGMGAQDRLSQLAIRRHEKIVQGTVVAPFAIVIAATADVHPGRRSCIKVVAAVRSVCGRMKTSR